MDNKENLEFSYSIFEMEKFGNSLSWIKLYSCFHCKNLKKNILLCGFCNTILCYNCYNQNNQFCLKCSTTNSLKKLDDFLLKTFLSFQIACPRNNCQKSLIIDELEIHLKNSCKGNILNTIMINGLKKYDIQDEKYIGKLENFCIEYFYNGKIKRKGFFQNNKMNGKGEDYLINGYIYYKGDFKNDLYDGEGSIYLNNNLFYDGKFKEGKLIKLNSYYLLKHDTKIYENGEINLLYNNKVEGNLTCKNDQILVNIK